MPFVLPYKKSFLYILLLWTPYIIIYQVTCRYHLFAVHTLPMAWIDRVIPFWPFMIPVYISYLAYVFFGLYRLNSPEAFTTAFILSYFQTLVSALFFIFFPVYYPEASFEGTGVPWQSIASVWVWFDEPFNCFPSLHTANVLLAIHINMSKKHRIFFLVWGCAVITSTVLCKRHYILDVAGGMAVYLVSIQLARKIGLCLKDSE